MLRFVTLAGILIALSNASLFCPHTKIPSDIKSFQTMRIQVKKAVGQEPMFRLGSVEDTDKSFTVSSPKFRLLSRTDNVECPSKGCITELSAAQPKLQSSNLYLTNIIGKMIPPGFHHVESSTRLYCAIVAGDCGATVPIYRYYKFLPSGLYHAYSTNEDIEIEGFTREPSPLCFGWQTLSSEQLKAEGIEGSGEDLSSEEVEVTDAEREEAKREEFKMVPEVCNSQIPPKSSSMKALNVYVNDKTGGLKDHYYTTKVMSEEDRKKEGNEFYGYSVDTKSPSIGRVVVDEEKSKCGCLIRLSQMLDEQDGMFSRKDHKLAADFKEPPPSGGEKYTALEEEVFCVRELGACGANVALRKYFHILELDTVYTVNNPDIPALTVPAPAGVLCYIWPNEKPHKTDPKKEEVAKKHKPSEKAATTTTKAPKTTAKPSTTTTPSKPTSSTTPNPKTTSITPPKTEKAKDVPVTSTTSTSTASTPKSTSTEKSTTKAETTSTPKSSTKSAAESSSAAPTTVTTTSKAKEEKTTAAAKKEEKSTATTSAPKTEAKKVETDPK